MIEIDWGKLDNRRESVQLAFESFCYSVAYAMTSEYGVMEYYYNTPGAEFYVELKRPFTYCGNVYPAGSIIGWQAKYWVGSKGLENSPLDSGHRAQLVDGFKKALEYKNNIAVWIICTPGLFVQKAWDTLVSDIHKEKDDVQLIHWNRLIIQGFLQCDIIRYNSVFQHFFSSTYIGPEKLCEITQASIHSLSKKYDSDLHTPSYFENALASLVDMDQAKRLIVAQVNKTKKKYDEISSRWDEEVLNSLKMPDGYIDLAKQLLHFLSDIIIKANLLLESESLSIACSDCLEYVEGRQSERLRIIDSLNSFLQKIRDNSDNHYDYYASEQLIKDINELQDLIHSSSKSAIDGLLNLMALQSEPIINVFAEAGHGKTHFACSIANKQIQKEIPVLLIPGSRFSSASSPQSFLKEILNCSSNMTFDDCIAAIDGLGGIVGHRIAIIIDGINECFPNSKIWKDELPTIETCLRKYPNVVLILTCREKEDYVQTYYGVNSFTEVKNSFILKGFEDVNLDLAIHKYFTKYQVTAKCIVNKLVFRNPLLLKVFCECNEGKKDLIIDSNSLIESIGDYSNSLIENISMYIGCSGSVKKAKHELASVLLEIGGFLWEHNTRQLDYWDDFEKIANTYSLNLVGEGICFQTDMVGGKEKIQFTYDMLAGYHIARYIVSKCSTEKDLQLFFDEKSNYNKLFGNQDDLHTLSEDIRKSLYFLISKIYGKPVFDIIDTPKVLVRSVEILDYFCSDDNCKRALMSKLAGLSKDEGLKKQVLEAECKRIIEGDAIQFFEAFIPLLTQISQKDLNLYFYSHFVTFSELEKTYLSVKNTLRHDLANKESAVFLAICLCGILDTEYRYKFMEMIVDSYNGDIRTIQSITKNILPIHDSLVTESIYIILTGICLRRGDQLSIQSTQQLLYKDYSSRNSSNIIMMDCLELLTDYCHHQFGLDFNNTMFDSAKAKTWGQIQCVWPQGARVFDYDFEKYKIHSLSDYGYYSISPYSDSEIKEMLYWKLHEDGYSESDYDEINKEIYEKSKYRYSVRISYDQKYGLSAYKELLGWMILNGYCLPEHQNSMRTSDVYIDPTFPRFMKMVRLDCNSYLKKEGEPLQTWLDKDPRAILYSKLQISKPFANEDMVLLDGWIKQKSERSHTELYVHIKSRLTDTIVRDDISWEPPTYNHTFVSEIGWRSIIRKEFDDYETPEEMNLYCSYQFSSWSSERKSIPSFLFLDKRVSDMLGLSFDYANLVYYDSKGNMATMTFYEENSFFFYIRKDLIEIILSKMNCNLQYDYYSDKLFRNNKSDWDNRDSWYKDYSDTFLYNLQ